ncbi:MAG: hypothetical protein PHU47_01120 [Candidatus ainarchaeum sp.]|nr:hypothetical protein [Candidatus ainarchaeum sp.]
MFKRSLSSLIATILLIVVSVILITVVLTWGSDFAREHLSSQTTTINKSDLTGLIISRPISNNQLFLNNQSSIDLNIIGYNIILPTNHYLFDDFSNKTFYLDSPFYLSKNSQELLVVECFPSNNFFINLLTSENNFIKVSVTTNITLNPETSNFIQRVKNDGGVIVDVCAIDNRITFLKANGLWEKLRGEHSLNFGIKFNSSNPNLVEKIYSIKGEDDFLQTNPDLQGEFLENGLNQKAILKITNKNQVYDIINDGKKWIRHVNKMEHSVVVKYHSFPLDQIFYTINLYLYSNSQSDYPSVYFGLNVAGWSSADNASKPGFYVKKNTVERDWQQSSTLIPNDFMVFDSFWDVENRSIKQHLNNNLVHIRTVLTSGYTADYDVTAAQVIKNYSAPTFEIPTKEYAHFSFWNLVMSDEQRLKNYNWHKNYYELE